MFSRDELNKYYKFAYSITRDKDTASELLHEAVFKILKSGQKEVSSSYMYQTLRTVAIDLWRKDRKHQAAEPLEEEVLVELAAPRFDDVFADRQQVQKIIEDLSEDESALLFLHVVEGQTVQEIADAMATPKGTILSRLHRLKGRLKKVAETQKKVGGGYNG